MSQMNLQLGFKRTSKKLSYKGLSALGVQWWFMLDKDTIFFSFFLWIGLIMSLVLISVCYEPMNNNQEALHWLRIRGNLWLGCCLTWGGSSQWQQRNQAQEMTKCWLKVVSNPPLFFASGQAGLNMSWDLEVEFTQYDYGIESSEALTLLLWFELFTDFIIYLCSSVDNLVGLNTIFPLILRGKGPLKRLHEGAGSDYNSTQLILGVMSI